MLQSKTWFCVNQFNASLWCSLAAGEQRLFAPPTNTSCIWDWLLVCVVNVEKTLQIHFKKTSSRNDAVKPTPSLLFVSNAEKELMFGYANERLVSTCTVSSRLGRLTNQSRAAPGEAGLRDGVQTLLRWVNIIIKCKCF